MKRSGDRRCCVRAAVVFLALAFAASEHATGVHAETPLAIYTHTPSIHPGDVVRLDVLCSCVPLDYAAKAVVFGRDVPLVPLRGAAGWSGLVGVDVETQPGRHTAKIVAAAADRPPLAGTHVLAVSRKDFPTRRLRVAPVYVDPPRAELERIAADNGRLNAIFATSTPRDEVGPFEAPLAVAAQNTFGARSLFNGQPRSLHAGVDFSSPAGTPIAAPADGSVVLADDLFFTGNTVVIDHGRGLYSVLAHLSTTTVRAGDAVMRGDIVGEVGATGRATGPHLHWSVRLNQARVNPVALIDVLGTR